MKVTLADLYNNLVLVSNTCYTQHTHIYSQTYSHSTDSHSYFHSNSHSDFHSFSYSLSLSLPPVLFSFLLHYQHHRLPLHHCPTFIITVLWPHHHCHPSYLSLLALSPWHCHHGTSTVALSPWQSPWHCQVPRTVPSSLALCFTSPASRGLNMRLLTFTGAYLDVCEVEGGGVGDRVSVGVEGEGQEHHTHQQVGHRQPLQVPAPERNTTG